MTMAPSSGRIVKSSKKKGGTPHHKNHRWESFTTKISKLNTLDPLKRVARHQLETEDLSTTTSYFKTGLERWQELTLSGSFIEFTHAVTPLCDSLPQILHFEDRIMDLLAGHLQVKERESMEPLLQLLADFSHDLGIRFEKHYARALELVISIARASHDVEVIEWSFTCLAFMFKYLSKLLVLDLRPTYDLMAPLLGKDRQQPHIARFAAEAMSFLIRKAAAPAVREKALDTIVEHAKTDLLKTHGSRHYGLYFHGLMTMFAEAAKGNGLTIHSSGTTIIRSMFSRHGGGDFMDIQQFSWADVICGVLTSLIHHSSSDCFKDVTATVLEQAEEAVGRFEISDTEQTFQQLMLSAKAMGILAGVRKGSRISDWPALLSSLLSVLTILAQKKSGVADHANDVEFLSAVVLSASIAVQYAPMDTLIPFISRYMCAFSTDPLSRYFLAFCSYIAEVDVERFRSFVQSYFQRFIVAHWSDSDNEDTLCILIPKLVSSGALATNYGTKDAFHLPQSWQDQIVSKFERLEVSPFPEQASTATSDKDPQVWHDRCLPKYGALLEILECTNVHPSTNARIAEIILRKLKLALRPSSALAPAEAHFIVGRGFNAFCGMMRGTGETDISLGPLLHAAAPRYSRLPNFLEAIVSYDDLLSNSSIPADKSKAGISDAPKWFTDRDGSINLLISSLVDNLCTEQHELRILSLRLLNQRYRRFNGTDSEALAIMLLIEQIPLDLQSARVLSMHIRTLASMYREHRSDLLLRRAIPLYNFGMLTVKFSKMWEDASAALALIAETDDGEEIIAEIAFGWLENPSTQPDVTARDIEQPRNEDLTDFECSNLLKLQKTYQDVQAELKDAQSLMLQKFVNEQQLIAAHSAAARSQALRVLLAVPQVAEKRSRQLVPMFLSWAGREELLETLDSDTTASRSDWTRKDQKALLELFSRFTNPKVLYKSADVYAALLELLANGDVEIQKSALKAIFTWKSPSLKPYEENLNNLLDEARFKDEITLLLQGQTLIQHQHRPELMPVILRLLYGRTVSKKGAASGKQGMEARRLIVLRHLGVEDMGNFLRIALGELKGIESLRDNFERESILEKEVMSVRRQVGFINMMEDVLKELGSNVELFTPLILPAILYCTIFATRQLHKAIDMKDDEGSNISNTSMLRVTRQTGLKCLNLLFSNDEKVDWNPYIPVILEELICPRIDKLPVETSQSVSGVLQLLSTWSLSPKTVLFLGKDNRFLPKVAECLSPPKSKDEVKLFVLGIIKNLTVIARRSTIELEEIVATVRSTLLDKNMDKFLTEIGNVLRNQQDLSKELLQSCVESLSELALFISQSTQAYNLVNTSIFLLDLPSRRVSPRTKSGLLQVLERFVPLYNLQDDIALRDRVYNTITSLLGFFRDRTSREVLSRVLQVYARTDMVMEEVAALCADLNSFNNTRLDEPDYDRRLRAFASISKPRQTRFNARQWRPLLYNLLYYIKHEEEFGILSSNSSDGICRFLDNACDNSNGSEKQDFQSMLSTIVLPAIYSGAREESEVIRREYLKIMARVVRNFPQWTEVSDMYGLLAGDDELESSFFNNILTTGKGRQSRALAQLASAAEKGTLNARNVSQFFIPLIEHFIFDRDEGSDAHNLAAEATTVLGVLASSLEWPQYRALVMRFIGYITSKPDLGKQIIRLLGKVIDALALAAERKASGSQKAQGESMIGLPSEQELSQAKVSCTLMDTLPKQAKFADDLKANVLPPLISYLHDKEESTVSLRVPVAVVVVKLLKLLPQEQMTERLAPVLTDICHILRSKSQESRDMTRDTLTKICVILGPKFFGFVLKELRAALARGYQLHVLSYTMHSILVATTPEYSPGDLDYCLPSIVAVIMDDIFGVTGQEKDSEEYVSKMKEVKSRKSHDSMELIAKTATLSRLTDLIQPIQVLLQEKLNLRMVQKIDELLSRVSAGLLKNAAAESRQSLIFCYEVIQDVYASSKPQPKAKEDYKLKKYLLQRGANRSGSRGGTTIYTYKLVRFALDVMRSILKRYDNLRTASNITGFLPILGDALIQTEDEVKIATFRLLGTIAKVPLKFNTDGTNLYKIAALEATRSILSSSSTTSDISQAALKLLSVILRDRNDVQVKETTIDDVLGRLRDDITDPERRHVTFSFLRALLDSKMESAALYDTLDYVGTVMVTNDDKDTRDLARGTYFQFLKEYPQKKNRWTKQLAFIVSNLKYDREGGRLSILEVIHLLLSKSSNDFVQEVSATCFVPLIFVLINDESEKCRAAAGEIVKEIFKKADKQHMQTFSSLLKSWVNEKDNMSVVRLGFLSYVLYFDARKEDDSDVDTLLSKILKILRDANEPDSNWEVVYAALQLTSALYQSFPSRLMAADTASLWASLKTFLSFPHAWVKLSSARLMTIYFVDFAKTNAKDGLQKLPVHGSNGLQLDANDIVVLIRRFMGIFNTPGITDLLATEVIKNLLFLGQCAAASDLKWPNAHEMRMEGLEADDDDPTEQDGKRQTALNYLFRRLSFILRRETTPPRAPVLIPKTAALQLLQALCSKLTADTILLSLQTILLPLHNLTDPNIPTPYSTDDLFKSGYEALKANCQELMSLLQAKCGTAEYTAQLLKVREDVKAKRTERSSKRKIEAVAAPEKFGKDKKKKVERKKERRKEKGLEHREQRRGQF